MAKATVVIRVQVEIPGKLGRVPEPERPENETERRTDEGWRREQDQRERKALADNSKVAKGAEEVAEALAKGVKAPRGASKLKVLDTAVEVVEES